MLSFHFKFVQTDRRTTVKQYAHDLSIQGHKNYVVRKDFSPVTQSVGYLRSFTTMFSIFQYTNLINLTMFSLLSVMVSI